MQPDREAQPDLIAQLDATVKEVFSLMLGRPCLPALPPAQDAWGLTAAVLFHGALAGSCAIHLDLAAAEEVTQHLIGEADASLTADTVGELCNMIAGTWKSRLSGPRATCLLTAPVVTPGPAEGFSRFYQFGESYLSLKLCLL